MTTIFHSLMSKFDMYSNCSSQFSVEKDFNGDQLIKRKKKKIPIITFLSDVQLL